MEPVSTFLGFPTDTVNSFTGFLTVIAAGLTAFFAASGLNTWRDEMKSRRRAELAEELMASFYEAEEKLGWIRFPASFGGEARDRPKNAGETEEQTRVLDIYYPAVARMQAETAFFAAFLARKHRARAIFGGKVEGPFLEIRKAHAEIQTAYSAIARFVMAGRFGANLPEVNHALWDRCEAALWGEGDGDKIKPRIATAVAEIEKLCRPAIEARAK